MNFSVKAILFKNRPAKDGAYRIAIRTTIDRRRTYQLTGYSCKEKDWPIKDKYIQRAVQQLVSDREREISIMISEGKKISVADLKKPASQSFVEFCKQQALQLTKSKAPGTVRNYDKQIKKFEEFYKGPINGITPKLLDEYRAHLANEGLSENSIWDAFKILKKFFNIALKRDLITKNPFVKMESQPKYRSIPPDYLVLQELDALESIELDEKLSLIRDYFLLECYSGIRFSDWSRFTTETMTGAENLKVRAKKNGEPVYIPISASPRLAAVIARIKDKPFEYSLEETNRCLKVIALAAKIKKNLRTHIGRHTFGVFCAELGLSRSSTAEIMGITEKVCEVYFKVTRSKIKKEFEVWKSI